MDTDKILEFSYEIGGGLLVGFFIVIVVVCVANSFT